MKRICLILLLTGAALGILAALTPVRAIPPSGLQRRAHDPWLRSLPPELLEKAASKMEAAVLAQLQSAGPDTTITAVFRLGGQADLRPAARLTTRAERGRYVYDALRGFAATAQAPFRAELATAARQRLVYDAHPFFIFNGVAVTARPEAIWQLALREDVAAVTANHAYALTATPAAGNRSPGQESASTGPPGAARPLAPEWNIVQINADDVWTTLSVTGTGVVVANIDSGVQYDHPALVNQYAGRQASGGFDHGFHWYDAVAGALTPYDDNNHGTHTMGTMAGGDGPGPQADDIGVAPGVRWIAVKAFSGAGAGTTVDLHEAFEWILAPCPAGVAPGGTGCDPARAPHVVNNSWGNRDGARLEFLPDVEALRAAGIWPAFSAGNDGPGDGTVGSPASFADSFATGATDSGDVIASFSSRGPSPLTAETKPDVTAPGVGVRSAVPGGGFAAYNGTSMAGPHSAGVAALLLSAAPGLDLELLEEILRSTAVDLGAPGPDMVYGHGRLDALRAAQRLINSGALSGVVRDGATLAPLGEAQIRAAGQGLALTAASDPAGGFGLSYLIPGPYTVTVSLYGYATVVTQTTIVTNTMTGLDVYLPPLPRYTLSGRVTSAVSPTAPITGAQVRVVDTPLAPVPVDAAGYYSLTVAAGTAVVEAAAFGFATAVTQTVIMTGTQLDFQLAPLPPVLLVDDDEGRLRSYSPHVEAYYFGALDANGYSYTYWDIEAAGAPDFDTMRQYAAVVWFGGEFGRIKDITDAGQAQVVMDYLDLGGRFFYVAQEHTFYYGDDADCDTPTWGGAGPCPFTAQYLGVADWVEDQKADAVLGVAGSPVGEGLGPFVMQYPPALADFSDDIRGAIHASLAFSATDDVPAGDVNDVAFTVVTPTADFKTVFMATPLEAMPPNDAADVMVAVMEWFGVPGLSEGVTLSPPAATGLAPAGDTVSFTLRLRNLNPFTDTFTLRAPDMGWPTAILDAGGGSPITTLGPVGSRDTADFVVAIEVPAGAAPGAEAASVIRVVSTSATPFSDETRLTAAARMDYYVLDSDQCDSGVHFDWADASGGERWDLDEALPLPEYVQVPLPQPFLYYNTAYDHIWINDHATVLFGDDNLYDDAFPSGNPPIPNPTLLDPNGALYLNWGTSYYHPSTQPDETAVYTWHDATAGRNRFVIEYHQYPNLIGDGLDTMQVILDLDTHEITMQYLRTVYHDFAVVGIEDQTGLAGLLYVNDQVPAEHVLHDGLAIRYGVGRQPVVYEAAFSPAAAAASGGPGAEVTYLLTLYHTSSVTDTYDLEVAEAAWPTTLWDSTFTTPLDRLGPLPPCSQAQVGVRVELPTGPAYAADVATVQARSRLNTLLVAGSVLTTDNAAPAVQVGPAATGAGASGYPVSYTLRVTNTGNITDVYDLGFVGGHWPAQVGGGVTETVVLAPGASQPVTAVVTIPAAAPAGAVDAVSLVASSQRYPGASAAAAMTTTAAPNVAVAWDQALQSQSRPGGTVAGYFVTVRNRGNLTDTFALLSLGDDWSLSLWNDSFTVPLTQTRPLGPDETQRLGVQVVVPATAAPPDQDGVLVQARSTLDPGVYDRTMLVTAVAGAAGGVQLAPVGAWRSATAGQTVIFTLRVTNTGAVAATYVVSLEDHAWATASAATVGPLAPGQASDLPVTVQAPPEVASGWDSVGVVVMAAADATVAARSDLLTVVGAGSSADAAGFEQYLPLLVRH